VPVDRPGRPFLSIVIPAYNEEARLGDSLRRIDAYVEERGLHAEIVVVDDGSTDGTVASAKAILSRVPGRVLSNRENRGKGFSVRRGVLEARGRWVLMSDADLSTPIEEHSVLAGVARDRDLDVAIGSRGLPESRVEIPQRSLRQFMGRTFNRVVRLLTGLPYRDTQCGFKLYDRERTLPLFERMVVDRFAFDVEFLFLCRRYGLVAAEVPVTWRNSPDSRVGLITDPLNMLADVLRVRWRFRRGLYDPTRPVEGKGA